MGDSAGDGWHSRALSASIAYAVTLRGLYETNPWPDRDVLEQATVHLVTELWDRGFTEDEIRNAIVVALEQLPGYVRGAG